MSNPHRAEVAVDLAGGRFVLRLTLQALAEIEAGLGAGGIEDLGARLSGGGLRSVDLVRLAGALARGGGATISDAALGQAVDACDLPILVEGIGRVFAASFGATEANPPDP